MTPEDLTEFRSVAELAIASGFKSVLVNPEHVIQLCDRIRALEAELGRVRAETVAMCKETVRAKVDFAGRFKDLDWSAVDAAVKEGGGG
jgi:hypothetical protein